MQRIDRRIRLAGIAFLVVAAIVGARAEERTRLRGPLQVTTRLVPVPDGACKDEPNRAPVVAVLKAEGAGDLSVLGPIFEEHSMCVRADGTFFDGAFTFTNPENESIAGQFYGALLPTFNSTFDPIVGPTGRWKIEGHACVSGGNLGRITNDCRSKRYFPARGIATLNADGTGDGVIYVDQTIGLNRQE